MKISDYFINLFQKPNPDQQDMMGRWFEQLNVADDGIFESEEGEYRIKDQIKRNIDRHISRKRKHNSLFFYPLLKVAAILVFVLGSASLFHYYKSSRTEINVGSEQSIVPGSRNAFIDFSDGASFHITRLSQSDALKQKGIDVVKSADGKIVCIFKDSVPQNNVVTVKTPVGSEFQLVLPDGTTVWMNAGSLLSFPQNFRIGERRVEAAGEVYFEVAKSNNSRFFVQSGTQIVEVLGTQFRVKTNDNDPIIKTTLLEGSIKLTNGATTKLLKPGQEARAKRGTNIIEVSDDDDPEEKVSWKDGYFSFANTDFPTAEEQIEKWYDVEFVYNKTPDYLFYGEISRSASIQEVLTMMELVGKIKFKIDGRKIYVTE